MKKITFMVVGILLVIGLVGAGTFAYFSDTETTGDNVFQAGTIDLTLGESDGAPANLTTMKPGDTHSGTITVTNDGTLTGHLYIASSYITNDGTQPPDSPASNDMTADQVAKMLLITSFKVDTVEVMEIIPDVDSDGRTTLYDLVCDRTGGSVSGYADPTKGEEYTDPGSVGNSGWISWYPNMAPNDSHTFILALLFDTDAPNDYQGDGITLTIEFLLTQQ